MFWDLIMLMGCRFVGKVNGSDIVFFIEIVFLRDSIYDLMVVKMGYCFFDVVDGLFFVKDVLFELGFNSMELFMLGFKFFFGNVFGFEIWKDV